ncbi:MAG: class I SAM-dependent methyltransferase [Candidatus Omnitrophica bacterium]|nr:class I SAM-dependent methyltransferase [Candidatus Omnitrophota bacterium]
MSVFDRYYSKYDSWYERNRFAYLSEIEALKKVIPKQGRGLEIGVGTGRFASALGITMGVDSSRDMLEIASRRGVNVRWGFGENLPFWYNSFDYVAIIVSLSFVEDPHRVLNQAWRVLKDKGKLIVAIINRDSFLGKFYQTKKSVFYKEANLFTVKELTALLYSTGFGRFSYYQTIFKLPGNINSVEKPLKGFSSGGFVIVSCQKIRKNKIKKEV